MAATYNYGPEIASRLGATTSPATGTVNQRLQSLAGFADGLEALLAALGTNTDGLEALATALGTNTDGLEGLLGEIRDALASTLSVQSRSVERTAFTYDDFDGVSLLTGYTEDGVVWTIDRNVDGTIASITSA